jgi:hypothetical protein
VGDARPEEVGRRPSLSRRQRMTSHESGARVGSRNRRGFSAAEVRRGRAEIETRQRQATALMPEGLGQQLSAEEFRDLLASLQSLR